MTLFASQVAHVDALEPREIAGRVRSVRGLGIEVVGLPVPVGTLVRIERGRGRPPVAGEVVGFDRRLATVMLFDGVAGIAPGMSVVGEQAAQTVEVGDGLMGRVIDGLGRPIDEQGPVRETARRPLHPAPLRPLERAPIARPLPTGVRAVDGLLTLGRGQRIGIFAGPGVGKSTLLGQVARGTDADAVVIALLGERGREVRDFIEQTLGDEGLERATVVVATGDESPLLRTRAAALACAIAEHHREAGRHALLVMDSITRVAQAQRQIGLTVGEPPTTRGYPPSVFAMLPQLLERAGATAGGSVTGLYTVLVEGDDLAEPISDAARGILDGHVALARKLAGRGHFPAIDVLESVSRVADDVCDEPHRLARRHLRRLLAAWRENEELLSIGAYAAGSDPDVDVAVQMRTALDEFLRQPAREPSPYPQTCRRLVELHIEAEETARRLAAARVASASQAQAQAQAGGNAR